MLETVKEKREEQRAMLDKNIIKPISDMIKLTDDVKKNKISIEHYIKRTKDLNKHLMGFFETKQGVDEL